MNKENVEIDKDFSIDLSEENNKIRNDKINKLSAKFQDDFVVLFNDWNSYKLQFIVTLFVCISLIILYCVQKFMNQSDTVKELEMYQPQEK